MSNYDDLMDAFDYAIERAQQEERLADESRPKAEVLAEFHELQRAAESEDNYQLRCIFCKKKVTGPRYREAVGEGHIYSDAGRREFSITGICEWCFDKVTLPDDEEETSTETELREGWWQEP
jgi:hypothetical protein